MNSQVHNSLSPHHDGSELYVSNSAPKIGGFLTYARPDGEKGTAPGQHTVEELTHVYPFQNITQATKIFAVAGWPVEHSLSPLLHNAAFAATQFNGS